MASEGEYWVKGHLTTGTPLREAPGSLGQVAVFAR